MLIAQIFGISVHRKTSIPKIYLKYFHFSQVKNASESPLANNWVTLPTKRELKKQVWSKTLDGQFHFIAVKNPKLAMK